jgi:hypothetical protein
LARGFESKSVADQQAERDAIGPSSRPPREDPAVAARRRRLELSRADILRQLGTAKAEAHKQMLDRALAALDKELLTLA